MSTGFFGDVERIPFVGEDGEGIGPDGALGFRHYDPGEIVLGKRLEDHLRFACAWWHSFAWPGGDPFGGQTFERPWFGDTMDDAKLKADVAFEMFGALGVPFFCFHDADIRPEGETFAENTARLDEMCDYIGAKMESGGVKLLWGTANLFSHRRYMAGAATNPDPDVFAFAAATVKSCMDATYRLGGANYVLWGGREGYETLLNTDMARELDQMGRFLNLVVEYKHKIGFEGAILVEPKPQEPTKHQYDHDVASVYGFLKRYGLEEEVRVNVEQGHAILAGHSFEHELALARALGIFGLDRHEQERLPVGVGTPISSPTTCPRPRSPISRCCAPAASRPAGRTSTRSSGGSRSIRSISCRARRWHGCLRPRAQSGRGDARERGARRAARHALRGVGERAGEAACGRGDGSRGDRRAGRAGGDRAGAGLGAPRAARERGQPLRLKGRRHPPPPVADVSVTSITVSTSGSEASST